MGVLCVRLSSLGQPQHPLGDDVPLDFGGAALNRIGARAQEAVLPIGAIRRGFRALVELAVRTLDLDRKFLKALVHFCPLQLGDRPFRAGRVAAQQARQGPIAVELEEFAVDVRLGQLGAELRVSDHRLAVAAAVPRRLQ